MINGELIDLVAGDYEARIASSGAMLVHLRRQGRDLIMPFDAETALPAGWQGKTLLPWANRIAGARYDYGGAEYLVACNEPASGSALHGLAGWMDWQVADDDPSGPDDGAPRSQVVLELSLLASYGYPWSLEVSALFQLDAEHGLGVTVTATNVGAARPAPPVPGAPEVDGELASAPYGVSCHPYLTRSVPLDDCVLTIPAAEVLDVDEHMAPTHRRSVQGTDWDWRGGRLVGTTQTDNAYTCLPEGVWEVSLRGGQGDRAVVMSSDTPWVQAYTADELSRPGVAIEPMTCPPNAFNSGEDLIALAVGQSHSFTYRLREED